MDDLPSSLLGASTVIITTPDPKFTSLSPDFFLEHTTNPVTIIDCWRCLPATFSSHPNINYVPLGCCTNDQQALENLSKIWSSPNSLNLATL